MTTSTEELYLTLLVSHSGNVDTQINTVTVTNHGFREGEKVIHTSTNPGGLENEVHVLCHSIQQNRVRFVKHKFEIEEEPSFINITSQGSGGTLSKINPLVTTERTTILNLILVTLHFHFLSNGVRYLNSR